MASSICGHQACRVLAVTLVLGLLLGLRLAAPMARAVTPSGFSIEVVADGLDEPTALAFGPGGRIFVAQKHGVVRLIKDGSLLPGNVLDLRGRVNDWWDRGLLGIAVDPNFRDDPYIYLFYVYENDPADPSAYAEPKTARVTRFTMDASGDVALPDSERVLLGSVGGDPARRSCRDFPVGSDCLAADSPSHDGGGLRFDSGGRLWVSVGDASSFVFADDGALRAQDVDSLNGKILRIDTDGKGLADNPFAGGDRAANRAKVWNLGLRNPFRFALRPGRSVPYIGDVGWYTWDEVNVGEKGANFGWPCWEGEEHQGDYALKEGCRRVYSSVITTDPLFAYRSGDTGAAVVGGSFYDESGYPPEDRGALFFSDYVRGFIKRMRVDSDDQLVDVADVAQPGNGPVDFAPGPGGDLYFVSYADGAIKRLRYLTGNRDPLVAATAKPDSGPLPLAVRFSSDGTTDPDGDPLSFSWDFGDGSPPSEEANPRHVYRSAGTFEAVLAVRDGRGGEATARLSVHAGNKTPSVRIISPRRRLTYAAGQPVSIEVAATDLGDGGVPDDRVLWKAVIHHCTAKDACHTHGLTAGSGTRGVFDAPDHDPPSSVELSVTAADSSGLSTTESVTLRPRTVRLRVASSPPGAAITLGGEQTRSTPFKTRLVVGAHRTISTDSPQIIRGQAFAFDAWSDHGDQQHDIFAGKHAIKLIAYFKKEAAP